MAGISYNSSKNVNKYTAVMLTWSTRLLSAAVWFSGLAFGLYILIIYGLSWVSNNLEVWNEGILQTYTPNSAWANNGMGVHFLGGGILLILGNIQLVGPIRQHYPRLHHWSGRLYVGAAFMAAIGGLVHIVVDGTIGGPVMNVGFGLYGILMLVAAVETIRLARAKRFDQHRIWALRLYVLALGSWLYRIQYGFWYVYFEGVGSSLDTFSGIFDWIMAFFFYIPNLLIVEWYIRSQRGNTSPAVQIGTSLLFVLLSGFVIYVAYLAWIPDILGI